MNPSTLKVGNHPQFGRGPSPIPDIRHRLQVPNSKASCSNDDDNKYIWGEEEIGLIRTCAMLSSSLGLSKSLSTSDINMNDSNKIMKPWVSEEIINGHGDRIENMMFPQRLEPMSRSCSTWVAVGDVVSTSQLPSPQARLGGSDSPAITAVDFIRSVNKKVRQNYIRRRLQMSYRVLRRISDHCQLPVTSSTEKVEPPSAPQQVLNLIRREAELPAPSLGPSCPLTTRDVDRDRGRPLTRYERNMIIFNWLQTLEGESYEAMYFESSTNFPTESIKIIGESIGIQTIGDDVAKETAEDITFRLKNIIQDAAKFMNHSKRRKLTVADIDSALQIKNIEPLYGIFPKEHIPFRFASGGGRELHFIEDKEIEINDIVSTPSPRFPLQMATKPHWLAIEGVQPSIPENPPPLSKNQQKKDSVDPAIKLSAQTDSKAQKYIHGRGMKSVETIKVKQLATHELSAEQQLYYKEITEACVGSDEPKRGEALHSLAYDPGLHQMVPRLCTFIAEGVRVNVVQKNLALLIYLMRMAKALLDNQTLYLEKYLHEITPSVMTCIVSRQLCLKPDLDNHWALRDFAARLISQICKNYNTTTNGLQTRITRVFSRCLNPEKTQLSCMYGAIAGLSELGPEVSKAFVLPKLRSLSDKIEQCVEGSNAYEKNAASHIKGLLIKTVAPILKTLRSLPDSVQDYKNDFGYLGPQLQMAVVKARQVTTNPSVTSSAPIRPIAPPTRIIQHANVAGLNQRTFVVNKPVSAVGPSQLGQKVIIMSNKTGTPLTQNTTTTESLLKSGSTSGLTVVSQSVGPKFVVVSAPNQQLPIKTEIKEEPMDHQPQNLDLL